MISKIRKSSLIKTILLQSGLLHSFEVILGNYEQIVFVFLKHFLEWQV